MLIQKLKEDLKQSMLNHEELKVSVIRMLISAARYKMVEVGKKEDEISDEDLIKVLEKQAKQRQDSIEAFNSGNRPDLADKEVKELDLIKVYLPTKMSEDETKIAVETAIKDLNISAKNQMGMLMGHLNKNFAGKMDMSIASKVANTLLN